MKTRFWETKTTFGENKGVVRRFRAESIVAGSGPRCDVKFPDPAPEKLFSVTRVLNDDGPTLLLLEVAPSHEVEIHVGGAWRKFKAFQGENLPPIRWMENVIELRDLTDERSPLRFEPERWAAEATSVEPDCNALWHIRDGVLLETLILEKKDAKTKNLKCGYRISWSPENPSAIDLIDYGGNPQRLEVASGRRDGSFRSVFENNVFVITRVPERSKIINFQLGTPSKSGGDTFKRALFALGATWILVMTFLQFRQAATVEEIPVEQLSGEMAKIILEAPTPHQDGGDRQAGGGGSEAAKTQDKRGGSGFEANRIAESAGPDEVVVKDKGALASLNKVEKVLGTGVLKALEVGGALSNALSALDAGVKSGKIKAAGIAGSRSNGKGNLNGVLGALGAMGGSGSGGGGVGIAGVGTHGFGGGAGGGKGTGFGTGVGSGLGKGDGNRNIGFESNNVSVRGGLERSEVEGVIQENLSQIRYCYNKGLRSNPSLQGKVTSAFTIGPDGQVKVSRVMGSTLASSEVEDCIKSRIALWKFPNPRGGAEVAVNYPFLFKAN